MQDNSCLFVCFDLHIKVKIERWWVPRQVNFSLNYKGREPAIPASAQVHPPAFFVTHPFEAESSFVAAAPVLAFPH